MGVYELLVSRWMGQVLVWASFTAVRDVVDDGTVSKLSAEAGSRVSAAEAILTSDSSRSRFSIIRQVSAPLRVLGYLGELNIQAGGYQVTAKGRRPTSDETSRATSGGDF